MLISTAEGLVLVIGSRTLTWGSSQTNPPPAGRLIQADRERSEFDGLVGCSEFDPELAKVVKAGER